VTPEKLIEENLPLVRRVAQRIAMKFSKGIDVDELEAFGREGLVAAASRYDPDRGVAFSTFAYYRVRGAIFDGLRNMGSLHKNPRASFERKADEYLESIGEEEHVPRTSVEATERMSSALSNLTVAFVACVEAIEENPDQSLPDPSDVAETREEVGAVRRAVGCLPDKERTLLTLMYFQGLSMRAAADELDMSKGWASRLHARALERLRSILAHPVTERAPPAGPMIRV